MECSDKKDVEALYEKVTSINVNYEDVMKVYDAWAETYEEDLEKVCYNPHQIMRDYASKYLSPSQQILDAASGTGLVGRELRSLGFDNIDALDGSQAMLGKAKERSIYLNYICAMMGPTPLPIQADTYDGVTITGAFAPGHVKGDCFPELIRITKPGGHILIVIRAVYLEGDNSTQYIEDVIKPMESLEMKGSWKLVEREIKSGYRSGAEDNAKEPALILVYKVL